MMRKLSWMSLVLLVLVGCGEEITKEEVKPKTVVETEPLYGLNGRTYRNKNLVFKVANLPVDEWSVYVEGHPFVQEGTKSYIEKDPSKNEMLVVLKAYFPKGEYIRLPAELPPNEVEALKDKELKPAIATLEIAVETQIGTDDRSAKEFAKGWMKGYSNNTFGEQGTIRTKDSYVGYRFYYVRPDGDKAGIAYFIRSRGNTKRGYRIAYIEAEESDRGRKTFDNLLSNLEFNTL